MIVGGNYSHKHRTEPTGSRHCYFTGNQKPYEKLKKALKAEVDEEAWAELYGTTSRLFPRPDSGRIAVKVINDYGDEVLKVFDV